MKSREPGEFGRTSRWFAAGTLAAVVLAGCAKTSESKAKEPVDCSGYLGQISIVDKATKTLKVESIESPKDCTEPPIGAYAIAPGYLKQPYKDKHFPYKLVPGAKFIADCILDEVPAVLIHRDDTKEAWGEGWVPLHSLIVARTLAEANVPQCTPEQAAKA